FYCTIINRFTMRATHHKKYNTNNHRQIKFANSPPKQLSPLILFLSTKNPQTSRERKTQNHSHHRHPKPLFLPVIIN
ncbi:hypothetical protein LBW52_24360, partial [Ralstonia solanacearum]|uniref:hypothetical protein n=1 Tax=Ralstonia solanacearum TaxID=305 RepID=UPI0023051045